MDNERRSWQALADFLQQWGMKDWTAALLEAAGPLSVVAAQISHGIEPFIRQTPAASHLDEINRLLDEPQKLQEFVAFLREEP